MRSCKTVVIAVSFVVSGAWLADAALAKTYDGVGTDVSVSTGQSGTTSGITGSDMTEADETMGEGLSRGDQMVRSAQDEPVRAVGDLNQPEEQAPESAEGVNKGTSGMPQASSPKDSSEGSGQGNGQDGGQN